MGFTNAFKNIAKIYQERWARKPTLEEVLTIVEISLGTDLTYSVSDADDQTYIDGIVVE